MRLALLVLAAVSIGARCDREPAPGPETVSEASMVDGGQGNPSTSTQPGVCAVPVGPPMIISVCPAVVSHQVPLATAAAHSPLDLMIFDGTLAAASYNPPSISSVVVSGNGAHTYIGRRYVHDSRAITVVTHSSTGKLIEQREIQAGDPLPQNSTRNVMDLVLDDSARRLYALVNTVDVLGEASGAQLLSIELDADGTPSGVFHAEAVEPMYNHPLRIALHPDRSFAYVTSYAIGGVIRFTLDASGDPLPDPTTYLVGVDQTKTAIAMHPSGARFYLGCTALEVVALVNGEPTVVEATLAWPAPSRVVFEDPALDYHYDGQLNFVLTPRAIFRQQAQRPTAGGTGWPIQSWQLDYTLLDADGALQDGLVQTRADLGHSWLAATPNGLVLASLDQRNASFMGTTMRHVELGADGTPAATSSALEPFLSGSAVWQFAASADGVLAIPQDTLGQWAGEDKAVDPVDNVSFTLKVSATEPSEGASFGPHSVSVVIPRYNAAHVVSLTVSSFDDVVPFASGISLQGAHFARAIQIDLSGAICASHATIELTMNGVDFRTGTPFSETITASGEGCYVAIFVDGNGVPYVASEPRLRTMESQLSHYALNVDRSFHTVQPREAKLSCFSSLGAGSGLAAFNQALSLLQDVGCNDVNMENTPYSYMMPAAQMHAALDAHGFASRSYGSYAPNEAYFSFDPRLAPDALTAWAENDILKYIDQTGGPRDRISYMTLADEPFWNFPETYDLVRSSEAGHASFVAFLKARGQTPALLGVADWSVVQPIAQPAIGSEQQRRLYYWSQRFFTESASDGMAAARRALEAAVGHRILTPVNFNNWYSWTFPSPNRLFGSTAILGPETAAASLDWFYSGRTSAHTLFSEDWFADHQARDWIYRAQNLRSAASLGDQEFGSYVVAATSSEISDVLSMRTLSLMARGAKLVSYFSFGPEPLFPGNCWSENSAIYPELQRANTRVAFADHIFATGKAAMPDIAILSPQDAMVWAHWRDDQLGVETLPSEKDARGVSLLLAHSGRDVQVLDDRAIADGLLLSRGVKALYVSTPNVSHAAVTAIETFVAAGGVLVLGAGAAVRDEYDSEQPGLAGIPDNCGRVFRYAGLPGVDYVAAEFAANRATLPDGYNESVRQQLMAWFAITARAPVLVDAPRIEALRIDADTGAAVTLLNWDKESQRCVTVRILGGAQFSTVSSSEPSALQVNRVDGDLVVQLTLARVAVLKLEY